MPPLPNRPGLLLGAILFLLFLILLARAIQEWQAVFS